MTDEPLLKSVAWVGTSLKDLREFPETVRDHMGYAVYIAQRGGKHQDAKVLSGFGGAGVVEIIKGPSRGHIPRRIHVAVCGQCLCSARLPEEIEDWAGNAAP
jgi:phage-related protein